MQNRSWLMAAAFLLAAPFICRAQVATPTPLPKAEVETEEIVVSATRLPIPADESPASVTVITARETVLPRADSAASLSSLRMIAETSIAV